MTDLMCEAPQCFNIRHTEKGVQTRRMKRRGENLHCIMAFQRLETSEWEPVIHPPELQRQPFAPSREPATIESLDSSDSDFPKDSESEDGETVSGARSPRDEVPQSEEVQPTVSSMSGEDTISLSHVSSIILPDIVSQDATVAFVPTGQLGQNSVGNLTLGTDMPDADNQLDNTLTPTKDAPSLGVNDDVETILLPVESLTVEGEYTQRSGTYRKSKPCLLPIATDASPTADSEHQLESQDGMEGGDYFRRSGTFRKKKPSLATSPNLTPEKPCSLGSTMDSTEPEPVKETAETDPVEVTLAPSDQGIQLGGQYLETETLYLAGAEDTTDDSMEDVLVVEFKETSEEGQELEESRENLRRSGTFRKERPSFSPHRDTLARDEENLLDPNQLDRDTTGKDQESRENLRRSGTFKKKRPSLDFNADVLARSDSPFKDRGDISPEDFAYLYSSKTPEPTETLPMVTLSIPGAEEIRLAISSEEKKRESVEEAYILDDGEHGLRRSKTFTKDEPSLQIFNNTKEV